MWKPCSDVGCGCRDQLANGRAARGRACRDQRADAGNRADLIKLAMVATAEWLRRESLGTRLIMQVHDELVFEVPDSELERVRARVPDLMCHVASLKVPLAVDIGAGRNWDQAH